MTKNFISNKDETVRMFKSNWIEVLSRVHPSVPLIIFLPVIIYLVYLSVFIDKIFILKILMLLFAGLVVWTLTEYTLHRFVFHMKLKSKIGKKIHFIFHGVHHDYPNDSKRLVMPPSVSIPLASLFYLLFRLILGNQFVIPFFAGFLIGYLVYDITHYTIHHFNIKNKYVLFLKKYHAKHHYYDSDLGFGVSSPIWDFIFNTSFEKKHKTISEQSLVNEKK